MHGTSPAFGNLKLPVTALYTRCKQRGFSEWCAQNGQEPVGIKEDPE